MVGGEGPEKTVKRKRADSKEDEISSGKKKTGIKRGGVRKMPHSDDGPVPFDIPSISNDGPVISKDNGGKSLEMPVAVTVKNEKEDKFEMPRKGAMITLARVNDYQELWAETEQKGDDNFLAKTRELWKEFAVHGILGKGKDGKSSVLNFTDLDGKSSLGLLKIAGINVDNVEYLKPGDSRNGKVNIDTGYRHGVVVEDEGRTAFMDHHADESGRDTSSTKITYELLTSLKLLQKSAQLDRLVDFVTKTDNRLYPNNREQFENSWRTIVGLQRFLKFEDLLEYFKAPRKPEAILNESGIKMLKLSRRSEEQKKLVEDSLKRLEEMETEGLIIDSARHGRIAVDIGKEVKGGFDAAMAFGCSSYIIWTTGEGFFISVSDTLSENFEQGKKVRGNMWIKPKDGEKFTVKLLDVLEKMTDGKLIPTGKLKEYLDKEKEVSAPPVEVIPEPIIEQQAEKELSTEDLEFLKLEAVRLWGDYSGLYLNYREHRKEPILFNEVANDVEQLIEDIIGHKSENTREQADKIVKEILEK